MQAPVASARRGAPVTRESPPGWTNPQPGGGTPEPVVGEKARRSS